LRKQLRRLVSYIRLKKWLNEINDLSITFHNAVRNSQCVKEIAAAQHGTISQCGAAISARETQGMPSQRR
jgi:hypothetical protein